jgi:DNA-binding LacI/PurR family transcriptional regulator
VERGCIALLRNGNRLEPECVEVCRKQAELHGYALQAQSVEEAGLNRRLQVLWAEGVQGLVIRADQGEFPLLPEPWNSKFPHVLVGGHPEYSAPHVAFDFSEAVRLGYGELSRAGCRRIGFSLVERAGRTPDQRAIGAVLALMREHRGQHREIKLLTREPGNSVAEILEQWIRQEHLDGLVTSRFVPLQMEKSGGRLPVPTLIFEEEDPQFPNVIGGLGFSLTTLHSHAAWMLVNRIERPSGPAGPVVLLQPQVVRFPS